MYLRKPGQTQRTGVTTVETAVAIVLFVMILFGIYEYGRFMFIRQLVDNAAREGARYAVVSTDETTVVADTTALVLKKMCGIDQLTAYYKCQVYMADSAGNNVGSATDAGFGQYIAVQVDYDYSTVVPSILFLKNPIRITHKSLMYSEAN